MLLDVSDSFFGHAIFYVFIRNIWIVIKVLEFPWCDITARRSGARVVWDVDFKTVLQWRVRFRPEMPFSEMPCRVAIVAKHFGHRVELGIQSRNAL